MGDNAERIDISWIGGAMARLESDLGEIKLHLAEMNGSVRNNTTEMAVNVQRWESHVEEHRRECRYHGLISILAAVVAGLLAGFVVHWLGG